MTGNSLLSDEEVEEIKENLEECPKCEGTGIENLYGDSGGDITKIGYCPIECSRCYGLGKVVKGINQLKVKAVVKMEGE